MRIVSYCILLLSFRLFHEKVREIDERMKHISEGSITYRIYSLGGGTKLTFFVIEQAEEYLQPLRELEDSCHRRVQTAGKRSVLV